MDTPVKDTLVARPLLTPVAQKLCRGGHVIFTSRTCVYSRALLHIEIVCCCLWIISSVFIGAWHAVCSVSKENCGPFLWEDWWLNGIRIFLPSSSFCCKRTTETNGFNVKDNDPQCELVYCKSSLLKHCWTRTLASAVSRPYPTRLLSVRISQSQSIFE
jgi:hypothetical protein